MRRIRIHNDVAILWKITYKDGTPFDLEGRDLVLLMQRGTVIIKVEDFIISNNIIQWVFHGKDQEQLGIYAVILCENNGEPEMVTIDSVDAFALVAHTVLESGNDEDENPRVYGPVELDTIVGTNKSVFWDENTANTVKLIVNGVGMTLVKPKMVEDLADDTYRKAEIDGMFTDVDEEIQDVVETLESLAGATYRKTEIDSKLADRDSAIQDVAQDLESLSADTYRKGQINAKLAQRDRSIEQLEEALESLGGNVYSKAQIDAKFAERDLAISGLRSDVTALQRRVVLLSDVEYAELERAHAVDPAKIYMVYEADEEE